MDEGDALVEFEVSSSLVVEPINLLGQFNPEIPPLFSQTHEARAFVTRAGDPFDQAISFKPLQDTVKILATHHQVFRQRAERDPFRELFLGQSAKSRPLDSGDSKLSHGLTLKQVSEHEQAEIDPVIQLIIVKIPLGMRLDGNFAHDAGLKVLRHGDDSWVGVYQLRWGQPQLNRTLTNIWRKRAKAK